METGIVSTTTSFVRLVSGVTINMGCLSDSSDAFGHKNNVHVLLKGF